MGIDKEKNKAYMKEYNKVNSKKIKEQQKSYYRANSDKIRAYSKEYYKVNITKIKEQKKMYSKKYSSTIIAKYSSLKDRAKRRGIILHITFEEYISTIQDAFCHYCSGKLPETGYGLDRVDNNKGYELDNVVPCCSSCNYIRGKELSYEETKVVIKALMKYRNKKQKENKT